uniref:Uncharacterized protein n=1 Tax=Anguilla anguilla TaxID=7936 RepID=A0A0E9ULM2_ANGAN
MKMVECIDECLDGSLLPGYP